MAEEINTTTTAGVNDDSNKLPAPLKSGPAEFSTPAAPGANPPPPLLPSPGSPPSVKPAAAVLPETIPENETELERIQRLKINTDGVPHSGAIGDDIAKILKEVKLPETRDFKAVGDAPKIIATMPEVASTPPKDAHEASAQSPQEHGTVTALHTLKDDMQDIVLTRKISLVRASALEQDKKRGEPIEALKNPGAAQRTRRTFAFIFSALLLLGLAGAALYGVSVVIQNRGTPATVQYPSIIFAESSVTLPIGNAAPDSLKQTIAQARTQSTAPLGAITRIIPTVSTTTASGAPTPATLSQFFTALGLATPPGLLRGLGDTFFFGIHTVDINAPVFVIPVTSYDLAFAGMLAWEPTMDQDLAPAFDAVPALMVGPDGLPTTRTFTDAVMLNYDVRELKDDSGNVVLYYSFPTPNILVIAESPNTFTEILSRLRAQRKL